jgi:hypothetical protein
MWFVTFTKYTDLKMTSFGTAGDGDGARTMATTHVAPSHIRRTRAPAWANFKPGDLVTTAAGYPVLYEVLTIDPGGLLRVRGANWASGYSATISAEEVRPVTGILSRP